jgi:four helix bundle protein
MSGSFKDLRVWRKSMELAVEVYEVTKRFPNCELYGLTNQIRRAAISVPSNIAEGKGHHSEREFKNYLYHARGSLLELQTRLMIARELHYVSASDAEPVLEHADALGRGLNSLINSMTAFSQMPVARR